MRLLFLLSLLAAAVAYARESGPTISSVDHFLRSINVNPALISTADKAAGGIAFTCSVLAHYSVDNSSSCSSSQSSDITDTNHCPSTSSQYLITESSPSYLTQAHAHFSATAYRNPACIYTPPTPEAVAVAVRTAVFSSTRFAIRSGGHSFQTNWANINDQLLISLSGIRDLEYDPSTQTLRVGFGNRWQDIYNYLAPYNRLVIGGRQGTVGMALTTGGGLSHSSNEYGWPSQNVLSYTLVLANGTIVTAPSIASSSTSSPHADLHFALKAGGNNFGVVTHITMRTVPAADPVWGGTITYSANYTRQFMAAMAEYQARGQVDDVKSAVLPSVGLNAGVISCIVAHMGGVERPEALRAFLDLPAVADDTRVHASFAELAAYDVPGAPRWLDATTTILLDPQTYVDILDIVAEYSDAMSRLQGGSFWLMPQPVSKSMVEASTSIGDDPMNVTPAAQLWLTLNLNWSLASDDAAARRILTAAIARIEAYTRARGVYDPFKFPVNSYASQSPFAGFGERSYARLREASKAYDPSGVFQRLVPGGWKLWR
ncbi:hypothetical protein BJX64DRAFT_292476 [Aspergillus heterothallicus]